MPKNNINTSQTVVHAKYGALQEKRAVYAKHVQTWTYGNFLRVLMAMASVVAIMSSRFEETNRND
jgi:hypothetical protein